MFKTNPSPRHSRITIGINKINLPAKENLTVVRAARNEYKRGNKDNFRQERQPPQHAPLKSAFRIPQFKFVRQRRPASLEFARRSNTLAFEQYRRGQGLNTAFLCRFGHARLFSQ